MEPEGAPSFGVDPNISMEQVLDMLKLLDYENKFCKQKGMKPFSKVYFAQPAPQDDQFLLFVSLVSWLLSINNHQVSGWNKYDNPMTSSQNIINELRKLGIDVDYSPNKLMQGHGDGVCTVLHALCSMSIGNRMKFKKPRIMDDNSGFGGGEDDVDDNDDQFEGNADVADMINEADAVDDDDIDEDYEFAGQVAGGGKGHKNEDEMLQQEIIHSQISRDEWMLEVERVTGRLKLNKNNNDGKEWRFHMDQTKSMHDNVKQTLPDVRYKLEKLADDVSKTLEKISKKETQLTRSFQGMTGDYRAHSENLKDTQENYTKMQKNVAELETELNDVNEKLDRTTGKIDDTGKSFSDNAPLQNIKKAITSVKNDIRNIDIRIGVVSNTLLQLKLKERTK